MPYSVEDCRPQVIAWIAEHARDTWRTLDIGAGSGTYGRVLNALGLRHVDAIEVHAPYVGRFALESIYRYVFISDVREFEPLDGMHWDLAIMGDVLEHLSASDARVVLEKVMKWADRLVVVVPWQYVQGISEDNVHEIHLQDDLTPEIMQRRYPRLRLLAETRVVGAYVWDRFAEDPELEVNNGGTHSTD